VKAEPARKWWRAPFISPDRVRTSLSSPWDCGSLVPTLIESELFGYVKGAFNRSHASQRWLAGIAEGGTVFLDEVGELPVDLQAKLLRAIQEKEIRPVGSTKRIASMSESWQPPTAIWSRPWLRACFAAIFTSA